MIKILVLSLVSLVFTAEVYSEKFSDLNAEDIESAVETTNNVSENVVSDIKPTESLDEASKPVGEVSGTVQPQSEPAETPEQRKEQAENPVIPDRPPQKPLGVREAEGKVIGEQ